MKAAHAMHHIRAGGFTLLELVVVVAIIGITSTLAVSGFQYFVRDQRVRNSSYELFANLSLARNEAIKRNATVTVTQASGGWQNGWTITASTSTIKNEASMTGITITPTPSGTTFITYNKSGHISAPASIPAFQISDTTSSTKYTRCLKIELSGLPRTSRGTCT